MVDLPTMPDTRSHRGPHPEDKALFSDAWVATLAQATQQLSWLLSRGYVVPSALKLVGDRHRLNHRQRQAVQRAACGDAAREHRRLKRRELAPGETLWVDGFNVLLSLEVALGGGVLFICQDTCVRDIASVHGTYRRVEETLPAIELLGDHLRRLQLKEVVVVLDAPVSNSGRLGQLLAETWRETVPCEVRLVPDADSVLVNSRRLVASADSAVIDRALAWTNLARQIVEDLPHTWLLDLARAEEPSDPAATQPGEYLDE